MSLAPPSLVAVPDLAFARLEHVLAGLGWRLESQAQQPWLVPGEPELALFAHAGAEARIHYTFNPVVRLRVLQFHGEAATAEQARVAASIAVLTGAQLEPLLASSDEREVLLGLFAADESGERSVLDAVRRLASHADPRIAGTARRVAESLAAAAAPS